MEKKTKLTGKYDTFNKKLKNKNGISLKNVNVKHYTTKEK